MSLPNFIIDEQRKKQKSLTLAKLTILELWRVVHNESQLESLKLR